MAGAFDHDLAIVLPRDLCQLAEGGQFCQLRFVVGIGARAGAEAVAEREGDVVGAHDFADFVEVGVEEIFLVMGEAPLGEDAAAAGDDAGGAPGGEGDEAEKDAGVDGEVIDALLGLLDQRVAVEVPRCLLYTSRCV